MAIRPVSPTPGFRPGRNVDMLTPRRLSKFLNSQDEWSLHSRRSFDETWIFSPIPGEREAVVHLPTDPGDVDYARRLIEAIEEIAMLNNSSVERLVGDVLSDGMDRVALRAMPTETQDPLGTTHSLAAIQNLMTFFAQISENSEIGRRIGQATRTTPSEAAKAGCVVLDLVPVPVFAVPAYLPQDTVASSMEANGQAEQGETAWIRRELTLTALRLSRQFAVTPTTAPTLIFGHRSRMRTIDVSDLR